MAIFDPARISFVSLPADPIPNLDIRSNSGGGRSCVNEGMNDNKYSGSLSSENPFAETHCGSLTGDNELSSGAWPVQSGDTVAQDPTPDLSFDLFYHLDVPEEGFDLVDRPSDGWERSPLENLHQNALPFSLEELKNSLGQGDSVHVFDSEICHSPIEIANWHEGDPALASLCSAFDEEVQAA
jgi:hypothetical protein